MWTFVKSVFQKFQSDQCTHLAAAISYYTIFSLFPLLLGLIAIAGLFLQSSGVQSTILNWATSHMPGTGDLIARNVTQVVEARGTIGVISIAGLLWSATGAFGALRTALNAAWGAPHGKSFVRGKILDLLLVATVGVLMALSVGLTWFLQIVSTLEIPILGLRPFHNNPIWDLVQAIAPFGVTLLVFLLVYRYVPNVRVHWRHALLGAAFAAPAFEIAKWLFVWYTTNLANYALVYGSLGAVIALLTWIYVSSLILLVGAEIGAVDARRGLPAAATAAGQGPVAHGPVEETPPLRLQPVSRWCWLLMMVVALVLLLRTRRRPGDRE